MNSSQTGESHERTNAKGFKEHWCGSKECQRWGNHSTDKHKKWKENRNNWKNNDVANNPTAAATSESTTTTTQAQPARLVTFLSALTGGSIHADPALSDSIEL